MNTPPSIMPAVYQVPADAIAATPTPSPAAPVLAPPSAAGVAGGASAARASSVAAQLVELAKPFDLFHADEVAYATVTTASRADTYPLNSRAFRGILQKLFWDTYQKPAASAACQDAIDVLMARAMHEGPERPVAVRLGEAEGKIYLDLANDGRQVIAIGPDGWQVAPSSPVRFVRPKGVESLPMPVRGGTVQDFDPFLNVRPGSADRALLLGWLVAALRPCGPFPILNITGEQGSAKTTTAKMLRQLIDPNMSPLRSEPRNIQDLMIAARNGWVIGLDNVSQIHPWLSDALCRISTGGGFATRTLYSDSEETIYQTKRAILINGIGDVGTRSDLLDRSFCVSLPRIPEDRRKTEADFWREFEAAHPRLLGVLLDAVACAMRRVDTVNLKNKPRMADCAVWVTAAEPALGMPLGEFMRAWEENRREADQIALEDSPIGAAMEQFVAHHTDWRGAAHELKRILEDPTGGCTDERTRRKADWPATPKGMAECLTRLAPNLARLGIEVTKLGPQGKDRKRLIHIRNTKALPAAAAKLPPPLPFAPPAPSAPIPNPPPMPY